MPIADVAILGSGPAAWAAASACCQAGLAVTLIAPNPVADWPQTYGVWLDQLDQPVRKLFGLSSGDALPLAHQWSTIAAVTDSERDLKRAYGLLDNRAVRVALQEAAEATGLLTVRTALVKNVTHEQWSSVAVSKGRAVRARIVIDATGAQSPFVQRMNGGAEGQSSSVMQAAYGVVAEVDRDPYARSVLMDWSGPNRRDASFLYALDLGGRWLLEETSLARNPALSPEDLKARLSSRLSSMGVTISAIHSEEHVLFPMNVALPVVGQRTLAIGAAGAVVHPATGYSVAASLRLAPRLAESLRSAFGASGLGTSLETSGLGTSLGESGMDAQSIADAGWRAIWPADRRKARNLESYGLDRLLTMNQSEIRGFFHTFFALGPSVMSTYLGGDSSSAELAAVMWKVFQKAPLRIRSRLASGNPLSLARTLLG